MPGALSSRGALCVVVVLLVWHAHRAQCHAPAPRNTSGPAPRPVPGNGTANRTRRTAPGPRAPPADDAHSSFCGPLYSTATPHNATSLVRLEDHRVAFRNDTVAVFLAGLRLRFLPQSFVANVVRAAVSDGFAVHVYLSLVRFDPQNASFTYRYLNTTEDLGPGCCTGGS